MNKADLVETVANAADLSKTAATQAVDGIISSITEALCSGEQVAITGFGTFLVSEVAAHTGRNPRTGEAITVPTKKRPRFKAGKGLKDAINDS